MNDKSMLFCQQGDVFSETAILVASDRIFYFDCNKKERGEYEVKLGTTVRGRRVYLLVSLAGHNRDESANDLIMKTNLMISALKNGDAKHVTLVINSMAYAQSDLNRERSPMAIESCITNFENLGADRIIFIDMHRQYWRLIGRTKKDDIRPRKIFAEDIKSRLFTEKNLIFFCVPGCESSRLESYRKEFPKEKFVLNFCDALQLTRLRGKSAVIIGNVVTDSKEIKKLITFLKKRKVGEIHAYITHPVGVKLDDMVGLDSLTISDALGDFPALPDELAKINLRVVSLKRFVGRVLREIDTNGSLNNAE